GVPHPTGFPLDMLLLQAAGWLPLGSLAFRQNLMVGWVGAAVLGVLAALVLRLGQRLELGRGPSLLGTGVMLGAFAFWPTWLVSVLAVEVYATALLLTAAAVLAWASGRVRLPGVLWGLALGAHVTAWLGVGLCCLLAAAAAPRP